MAKEAWRRRVVCRAGSRRACSRPLHFMPLPPFGVLRAVSLSNGSRLGPEKSQQIFSEIITQAR